ETGVFLDRAAQAGTGQTGGVEPELLDLTLTQNMVGEEVAGHTNVLVAKLVVALQELNEEANHLRVRVREPKLISPFRTFGPIEHAACKMERIASPGQLPSGFLSPTAGVAPQRSVDRPPFHMAAIYPSS